MPIGTNVEGKMVAGLRRLGFDKVFDTDFGADLTIVEEANELVERIKNGGTLPMITSCSPGWVKFCEFYYPDMLAHLSSCKSPQQMSGAVIKTYYAEKNGIDPKDIFVVSIMPCTAKKFEITRDDQNAAGVPDVDVALTTREAARMFERLGINFNALPDEELIPRSAMTPAQPLSSAQPAALWKLQFVPQTLGLTAQQRLLSLRL
jgi:NADP-reducing hydrogenase subunit HndD